MLFLSIQSLERHLLGTLESLVTTNEASCMNKDAARNATDAI